jgi:4-aminobutyrate aminotransferase
MIGLEMVEDHGSRAPLAAEKMGQILTAAFEKGIILVPCGRNGNVLRIMPSLTISRDYLFKAVDILLEAIATV